VKAGKSPLDKVLGRLDDLDEVNLGILVQRLARERKLLETVFDVIRDGILVLDGKGDISYANIQGKKLIGLKDNQSTQVSLQRAAPEIARAIGLDHGKEGTQAEVIVREMEISYPELRYIRVYAVPIEEAFVKQEEKEEVGIAIILTDITEEKVSLEERIESERVASIMDLAAGVAHELGNPLNSIHIHLQVLRRSLDLEKSNQDKSKKSLTTCINEVERLDGIIAHFLKAIRPQTPDFKKINILNIIEETVHLKKEELNAKKINISMEAGVREPIINGDSEQLKQVFFNIIGNAIEAISKKSEIRILTGLEDRFVFVKIIDHGSGISKDDLSKVFEPYYTTKKSGHGIGMMIVHRIMRDHGGDVGIDSKVGAGTIITLRFPRNSARSKLLESTPDPDIGQL
jgi:nitrogen fixation/metabolism regulation signal transduction histidine kinase